MSDITPVDFDRFHTLKVKNLNFTTTEQILRNVFSKYGEIAACYIVKNPADNTSRGFGFVKYFKKSHAVGAAFYMHHEILEGRIIEIYLADKKLRQSLGKRIRHSGSSSLDSESTKFDYRHLWTVKVVNLNFTAHELELKEEFCDFGRIADIYVPRHRNTNLNKGYGFVRYYRKSDAWHAIRIMDNQRLNGRRLRVFEARYGKPPPRRRFAYGSTPMYQSLLTDRRPRYY